MSKTPRALTLKITLENIEPQIWRRVAVPDDMRLSDLHAAIQATMGWEDCHLHDFLVDDTRYGAVDPDAPPEQKNEHFARLADLVGDEAAGFTFFYMYDYGDDWEHRIEVEGKSNASEFETLPQCIDGQRACPPEDCGGPWGYAEFLEAMADPEHEEHAGFKEWIGGAFDPEAFDPAWANRRLTP